MLRDICLEVTELLGGVMKRNRREGGGKVCKLMNQMLECYLAL